MLTISFFYLYPLFIPPPKPTDFADVTITLQRLKGGWGGPEYKLTISGDGRVVYDGRSNVNTTGTKVYYISQDKFKELVDEFYYIDYFAKKDIYYETADDLPITITSITIGRRIKKVTNYYGAPAELYELEDKIDEVVDSRKWVEGE